MPLSHTATCLSHLSGGRSQSYPSHHVQYRLRPLTQTQAARARLSQLEAARQEALALLQGLEGEGATLRARRNDAVQALQAGAAARLRACVCSAWQLCQLVASSSCLAHLQPALAQLQPALQCLIN